MKPPSKKREPNPEILANPSLAFEKPEHYALFLRAREELDTKGPHDPKPALGAFINQNMGLVHGVIHRYIPTYGTGEAAPRGVEWDDLRQEGAMGLQKAVEKMDLSRGTRFSTHAYNWIKQFILRSLKTNRRVIRLPAHVEEQLIHYRKAVSRFIASNGRAPNPKELSALGVEHGFSPDTIALAGPAHRPAHSLDMPTGESEEAMGALIAEKHATPPSHRAEAVEWSAQQGHLRSALQEVLASLHPRDEAVVRMFHRYPYEHPETPYHFQVNEAIHAMQKPDEDGRVGNITYTQVGAHFGFSGTRTERIIKASLARLRERLKQVETGTDEESLKYRVELSPAAVLARSRKKNVPASLEPSIHVPGESYSRQFGPKPIPTLADLGSLEHPFRRSIGRKLNFKGHGLSWNEERVLRVLYWIPFMPQSERLSEPQEQLNKTLLSSKGLMSLETTGKQLELPADTVENLARSALDKLHVKIRIR